MLFSFKILFSFGFFLFNVLLGNDELKETYTVGIGDLDVFSGLSFSTYSLTTENYTEFCKGDNTSLKFGSQSLTFSSDNFFLVRPTTD